MSSEEQNGGRFVVFEGTFPDERPRLVHLTSGFGRLDAEWISAKKDWQEKKRHAKEHTRGKHPTEGLGLRDSSLECITLSPVQEPGDEESHQPASGSSPAPASSDDEPSRDSGSYQPEMDEMRCVLYAHGGMNLSLFFPSFSKLEIRRLLFR